MKSILLITIIILASHFSLYSQDETSYISPGVTIAWDLNGNFVFSPKLSFGYYKNKAFYNITLGISTSRANFFYFVEPQFGILSKLSEEKKTQIFSGAGVGINYHPKETSNPFSFRTSAFCGYIVFLKATLITKDSVNADFGLETVLPIPLNFKLDFGSPGG